MLFFAVLELERAYDSDDDEAEEAEGFTCGCAACGCACCSRCCEPLRVLVLPYDSPVRLVWDSWMIVLLLYSVAFVPLDIAFRSPFPSSPLPSCFISFSFSFPF